MKFADMNDKELMEWYRIAVEMRDGKYIKAIRAEMTRRNRDD